MQEIISLDNSLLVHIYISYDYFILNLPHEIYTSTQNNWFFYQIVWLYLK